MDSQVREENSSSQNVNLFITAISERGTSGSGYTVRLSDGSSFFVSLSFYSEFQLTIDKVIGSDLLELLEIESEKIQALHKAGDLISRAEQSSGGLYLKLKKKGFSDSACLSALEKVQDLGLLDDLRFSEFWITGRLRKHPEGRSMLLRGLLTRGVSPHKAKSAIELYVSEEDLYSAVMKAGEKLSSKYEDSEQKLQQALYRRGFSTGEINYFLHNRLI
jgi:regulatory protein